MSRSNFIAETLNHSSQKVYNTQMEQARVMAGRAVDKLFDNVCNVPDGRPVLSVSTVTVRVTGRRVHRDGVDVVEPRVIARARLTGTLTVECSDDPRSDHQY